MDKKIKLTDEEIVKALERCSCDVCSNCCLYGKVGMDECTSKLAKNAFELVNRLRSENEELNKDYIELDLECRELRTELDKELAEHEEFTKKAKAEIERLTEELEKTKDNRNGWRNRAWNDEKVISQLTEKLDKANAKLIEEYGKNAKLQKQVDDYEKALNYFEERDIFCEDCKSQAVKDTAKEICDLILEHWEKKQFVECDWLRVAISERYGVEVE